MPTKAAALRREIEAKLAARIPAALSPMTQPSVRLQPTGNPALNALLGGGFPIGSLCEVTGPESSGRSAIALSLLAAASQDGACAYIDVSDACSPHSAAAAGVLLRNLLWVRFPATVERREEQINLPTREIDNRQEVRQNSQQHCGGHHPRGEVKGLAPALEQMLHEKNQRRHQKMEGTPGYPNQTLHMLEASPDQVEWEQFNTRKPDERDPLHQLDQAAAEAARQRSSSTPAISGYRAERKAPWTLLDRALRATDQILQAGGFRVVVLDLASVAPQQSQRIQSSSWWRYQKAAKHSDSIFLVLSQAPCARSSADCILECSPGHPPTINGVLTSSRHAAQITRQRTGSAPGKKAPGRVTRWETAPSWMRAVGG